MNRRILLVFVTLMAVAMIASPLAVAKPWETPKNNDKFQSFSAILNGLPPDYVNDYKPNQDNPNVIIQSWGNNIVFYDIMIGEDWHYYLNSDFEYDQVCVHTAIGDPFKLMYGLYFGSKSNHLTIEYQFDFSAVVGGIDGTLEMLMVDNNGITSIRSLKGTGDLQNVQIMATASALGSHEGIVIGWPDIPPAT